MPRPNSALAVLLFAMLAAGCGNDAHESDARHDKDEPRSAMTSTRPAFRISPDSPPPAAEKRPATIEQHGITRTDAYAWLRDANWQEVLRDPTKLAADIRPHLEAENRYYEDATADLAGLRETLVEEMRGRIKEDDSSVPVPDGPWSYSVRYREG